MPVQRVFLAGASLFVGCFFSWHARAQTVKPSTYVDSDSYTSHADQSADLIGHVKIIRGDEQLTCDRAHVNPTKNEVDARGNVILISPKNYVKAERMIYNFG